MVPPRTERGSVTRPDDADDLVEALRDENASLRQRIAALEAATDEYRRQMSEVLTSVSWRVTSPIRMVAGTVRLRRHRLARLPRRLTQRAARSSVATAGLFPPTSTPFAQLGSPLLRLPRSGTADHDHGLAVHPSPSSISARILVVAHVYYPEVWQDIEDRLARIPEPFDLVVTLVEGRAEGLESRIRRGLPLSRIHIVPNSGRDMGPTIALARRSLFDGYDAVLKVHTKRSPHRLDGDAWRIQLLDGVLQSPQSVARTLELLRTDRSVGIVAPTGHVKAPETWGADLPLVEALASRIPMAFDPDSLRYPAGSMYWARPWVLKRLADLHLTEEHFEPEADHLDGSTAHALERFVGVVAAAAGLTVVETDDIASRLHAVRRKSRAHSSPDVLAYYLPQFHRDAANDEFWGEGFTDWDNVAAARPQFHGHAQPATPGELGRYDLADPEVMRAQGALAREYGLSGFLIYHYWFDGRQVLGHPLYNLLADPTIDFPFALCWANENWTRRWDGHDSEVLIAQTYPFGWVDAYYDDIRAALGDSRYLRVGGRPLLVVYRIGQVPDAVRAIERWRERAAADGLGGLHVLAVTPSRDFEPLTVDVAAALDGLAGFPPGSSVGLRSVADLAPGMSADHRGDVFSYDVAATTSDVSTHGPFALRVHPGVMPGWDNTARRDSAGYVFHGANPSSFRHWLARAVDSAGADEGGLVLINAWNEWAEGAYLEPDARFRRGNLEAIRDVLGNTPGGLPEPPYDLPVGQKGHA
jgi:lipopolysaccharide biosynthesis protein